MKAITYKPFITQYKPPSTPTFKPEGYKPQYNWKDTQQDTDTSTSQETSESPQPTETWVNPEGTTLITDLSDPAYKSSKTTHIFKDSSIDVGNMQELLDKFADAGISLRITSGYRPGARTSSGNQSWHSQGYAIDVTPGTNETWASLRQKLRNSPELIKWMQDKGYGIIDETTPEMQSRTGATGAHWHIGKDQLAISGLQTLLVKSGIKIPTFKSGDKVHKNATKRLLKIAEQERKYKQQSSQPTIRSEEPLAPVSITSILPGTGDIAEGAQILNDITHKNFGSALLGASLFALPGNFTKLINPLGFKFNQIPVDDYIFINTSKGPAAIKLSSLKVDKDIQNTISNLAQRYNNGGADRTKLPNLSKKIQTTEPLTGELEGLVTARNLKQPSFNYPEQNNIPSFIFLSDAKTTLPEVGNNTVNKQITQNQRRQLLDHEIQHKIDSEYRPDFYSQEVDFVEGTPYQKRATEVGARVGQIKDAANITDGSKIFTEEELKDLFSKYLNNPENIDNGISTLQKNIKDWTKFTKWVNENVPLINKSFRYPLYINSKENESED